MGPVMLVCLLPLQGVTTTTSRTLLSFASGQATKAITALHASVRSFLPLARFCAFVSASYLDEKDRAEAEARTRISVRTPVCCAVLCCTVSDDGVSGVRPVPWRCLYNLPKLFAYTVYQELFATEIQLLTTAHRTVNFHPDAACTTVALSDFDTIELFVLITKKTPVLRIYN